MSVLILIDHVYIGIHMFSFTLIWTQLESEILSNMTDLFYKNAWSFSKYSVSLKNVHGSNTCTMYTSMVCNQIYKHRMSSITFSLHLFVYVNERVRLWL